MKKLSLVLCAFAMLMTLSGCKDARAEITDGSEAIVSVGKESVTKSDIYELLKNGAGQTTISLIQEQITKLEKISLDADAKAEAKESFDALKNSFENEKQFNEAMKSAGYKDEKDYLEKVGYPAQKNIELVKKYIKENEKAVFDKYHPVKAVVIQTSAKEKATKALAALKDGEKPTTIAKKYGNAKTFDGKEDVYFINGNVPGVVFDKMAAATKQGVIDEVIEDAATQSYYVVKMVNLDPNSYKEEAASAIAKKSGDIVNEMLTHYLKKYHFTVYDKDIYDQIKRSNANYITQ